MYKEVVYVVIVSILVLNFEAGNFNPSDLFFAEMKEFVSKILPKFVNRSDQIYYVNKMRSLLL